MPVILVLERWRQGRSGVSCLSQLSSEFKTSLNYMSLLSQKQNKTPNQKTTTKLGLGYSSVVEHLTSMYWVLGSILSTGKIKFKNC